MTNKLPYILLTLFFSFFIGLFARAEISQLTSIYRTTSSYNTAFQKLGTGYSEYVKAIYVKFDYDYNSGGYASTGIRGVLVECPNSGYTGCTTVFDLRNVGAYYHTNTIYLQNGIDGTFGDSAYQMLSNKYYYIYVTAYQPQSYGDFHFFGATAGYASTVFSDTAECGSFGTPCNNNVDYLYFRLLNGTDVYQTQSRVSRLTPASGQTDLENNVYFSGFYSNVNYDRLVIDIYNRDLQKTENVISEVIPLGYGLPYVITTHLNNANYSYRAFLFNYSTGSSSPEFYNQTSWYFTVGTTTAPLPALPCDNSFDMSEETLCAGIATTTSMTDIHFLGDFECAIKKAGAWAFYPDCNALNEFTASYAELKKAFPFNAYFGLTDVLTGVASSTASTTTSGTFKVPFIHASGTFYMLPVMSSTSLPNLIGGTNYNLFRNSISWILWLAGAVLVFITFKKI